MMHVGGGGMCYAFPSGPPHGGHMIQDSKSIVAAIALLMILSVGVVCISDDAQASVSDADTFNSAITSDNFNIKLTSNITLSPTIINKTGTIDLNGHSISSDSNGITQDQSLITIENATVTVTDNSTNTAGKITANVNNGGNPNGTSVIKLNSGATLILSGGTIGSNNTWNAATGQSPTYTIQSNPANDSKIVINGGNIVSRNVGIQLSSTNIAQNSTSVGNDGIRFIMTGGSISATNTGIAVTGADGRISISSGSVSTTATSGNAININNNTSHFIFFDISGGSFTGNIASTDDDLVITGGTFSTNPTQHLSDGFAATDSNGTYTVSKTSDAAQIGSTTYATLAAAANAANSGDTITLLRDAEKTPVSIRSGVSVETNGHTYYSKILVTSNDGTPVTSLYSSDGYYDTMTQALRAAKSIGNADLYIAQDSKVVANSNHPLVMSSVTIHGNGSEMVYSIKHPTMEATLSIESGGYSLENDISLTISDMVNPSVWGERTSQNTLDLTITDCEFNGNVNGRGRVYLSGDVGESNYTITGCKFTGNGASDDYIAISTSNTGNITIADCEFTDINRPISISIDSTSGSSSITIRDTTFTDCVGNDEDDQSYLAPIFISNEGGAEVSMTVDSCNFLYNDATSPRGDILIGTGKEGYSSYEVSTFITGTDAEITVQQPGAFDENGNIIDSSKTTSLRSVADRDMTVHSDGSYDDGSATPSPGWDDDDYPPIPPMAYEDSDDDATTVVACAAAAVVAALMAAFLILDRKR